MTGQDRSIARQLPTGDRQFIILPNTAHSPIFAKTRQLLWHVTRSFLDLPDATT
jgi:hypothetical protein